MVQLIGLLMCVYLVYKGYEILQIALCSSRDDGERMWALLLGALFFVGSVVIAGLFALLFTSGGSQSPKLP